LNEVASIHVDRTNGDNNGYLLWKKDQTECVLILQGYLVQKQLPPIPWEARPK